MNEKGDGEIIQEGHRSICTQRVVHGKTNVATSSGVSPKDPHNLRVLRMLIKVHDPIMSNGEAVGCCKFPFLEAQAVHVVLSTTMIGTETDGIIVC